MSRYILSTDGMWHGAIDHLEPASMIDARLTGGRNSDPFFVQTGPTWGYLMWALGWMLIVLAVGVFSFERREL